MLLLLSFSNSKKRKCIHSSIYSISYLIPTYGSVLQHPHHIIFIQHFYIAKKYLQAAAAQRQKGEVLHTQHTHYSYSLNNSYTHINDIITITRKKKKTEKMMITKHYFFQKKKEEEAAAPAPSEESTTT